MAKLKLNYSHLRDRRFMGALNKLTNVTTMAVKEAYNVGRIRRKVLKECKVEEEMFTKIVKKYCLKNEDGSITPNKVADPQTGEEKEIPNSYKIAEENMEAFNKDIEELQEIEFEVESYPVALSTLEGAQLTPIDLDILEPILDVEETPPLAPVPSA